MAEEGCILWLRSNEIMTTSNICLGREVIGSGASGFRNAATLPDSNAAGTFQQLEVSKAAASEFPLLLERIALIRGMSTKDLVTKIEKHAITPEINPEKKESTTKKQCRGGKDNTEEVMSIGGAGHSWLGYHFNGPADDSDKDGKYRRFIDWLETNEESVKEFVSKNLMVSNEEDSSGFRLLEWFLRHGKGPVSAISNERKREIDVLIVYLERVLLRRVKRVQFSVNR